MTTTPISIYYGGQPEWDEYGVRYSMLPWNAIWVTTETTFEDVKSFIYSQLQLSETEYSLKINGRFNVSNSYHLYFSLTPVNNEQDWRSYLNHTTSNEHCRLVELYLEVVHQNQNPNQLHATILPPNPNLSTSSRRMHKRTSVPNTTPSYNLGVRSSPGSTGMELQSLSPVLEHNFQNLLVDDMHDESPVIDQEREENHDDSDEFPDIPVDTDGYVTGETDDDTCDEQDFETYNVRASATLTRRAKSKVGLISGRKDLQHHCSELGSGHQFFHTDVDLFGQLEPVSNSPIGTGRIFQSQHDLKQAVRHYHVKHYTQPKIVQSSKSKYVVKCEGTGYDDRQCGFHLSAYPIGCDRWRIKRNDTEHSCTSAVNMKDNSMLTAKLIGQVVLPMMTRTLNITIDDIRAKVQEQYPGMKPEYNKLWRGREEAYALLFGNWDGSYRLLPQVLMAIKGANPGTKWDCEYDGLHRTPNHAWFTSISWAFGPCIEAFRSCRPVISIDACFLSGRYGGKLLCACGYDAEGRILPLAFSIVRTEEIESWGPFMHFLRYQVLDTDQRKICVISDRHRAIKHVMQSGSFGWCERWGATDHRYCIYHVSENLYRKFKNQDIVKGYFRACKTTKDQKFDKEMATIEALNKDAHTYLMNVGKFNELDPNNEHMQRIERWAHSRDNGCRWGILTTNGSESLNAMLKVSRRLPVLAVVEDTFQLCVQWFEDRRNKSVIHQERGIQYCKVVWKKIQKRLKKGRNRNIIKPYNTTGDVQEFEVITRADNLDGTEWASHKEIVRVPTEVNKSVCTCKKPQLLGYPCSHLMSVIGERQWDLSLFISDYYSTENLVKTWSPEFHGYGDPDDWPVWDGPKLVPRDEWIQKGPRRTKRRPMVMDEMNREMSRDSSRPRHATARARSRPSNTSRRRRADQTVNVSSQDATSTVQSSWEENVAYGQEPNPWDEAAAAYGYYVSHSWESNQQSDGSGPSNYGGW